MKVLGSWYYNGFKSLIAVKLRLHTAINRVDFVSWWQNAFLRKWHCAFECEPLNHIHHDTKYARLIAVSKRTLRGCMDRASTDAKLKPTPPIWRRAFEVYMRLASQRGKASLCFFRWKSYEGKILTKLLLIKLWIFRFKWKIDFFLFLIRNSLIAEMVCRIHDLFWDCTVLIHSTDQVLSEVHLDLKYACFRFVKHPLFLILLKKDKTPTSLYY